MNQLAKLAQPFPDRYVKSAPKGKFGSYVEHSTINQALLATVGPFSTRVQHIIRDGGSNQIVGVVLELIVHIDGEPVSVQEAGDCERPENWNNDGARLKDAMSDAFKRCAMRIGLGLHLWAQDDYFLHLSLAKKDEQ